MIQRTINADPWIGKIGLALIATGTACFFAWPADTFGAFPASYRLMAEVMGENQWAALYAVVAALTWLALWLEGDGPRGAQLSPIVFALIHGPLWFFTAWSAISATPAAYFPWWSMAAFVLAEWIVCAPMLARWYEGRGA